MKTSKFDFSGVLALFPIDCHQHCCGCDTFVTCSSAATATPCHHYNFQLQSNNNSSHATVMLPFQHHPVTVNLVSRALKVIEAAEEVVKGFTLNCC